MNIKRKSSMLVAGVAVSMSSASYGFQFDTEFVKGDLTSTIATGFARRVAGQSCGLVGDPNSSCGASANVGQFSNGDDGDLNYKKGDLFALYIKGTHELLLTFPEGYKFFGRGTWLRDFKAADTRRTELTSEARDQVARDVRLLDLWASKDFNLGGQTARLRLGNQVMNWGESVYGLNGLSTTNSLDFQKLLVPGTQLKEAVIPAPMISFATGLGHGLSLDTYYQLRWNRNRYPPVGSYWSASDIFDKGKQPLYLDNANFNFGGVDNPAASFVIPFAQDKEPKKRGQYGVALHYKPEGTPLDLGFYYLNYHDKAPVLSYDFANNLLQWNFLEDRKMYGVSANFPLGDWAMGWELSYRPKDAVALSGCFNAGTQFDANLNTAPVTCPQWIDQKRYQMHIAAQLNLTPANYPTVLQLLGNATTSYLTAEAVFIHIPGVSPNKRYARTIDGVAVEQGPSPFYAFWRNDNSGAAYPIVGTEGTATSWGFTADFNWTYDGSLIPGWQVTPGVTYFRAVSGNTPTFTGNYLKGVQYANLYILFNQNPVKWQAGLNYSVFFGADPVRQVYGDRDFVGGFVAFTF